MTRYVDSPARGTWARALRKVLPAYRPSSMGGPTIPPPGADFDLEEVADHGERVIPDRPDYCYYAHLSIYNFAKPYAYGRHVLDAGCGTGYGSHYLFSGGARSVLGIDLSEKAIGYCRSRFAQDGLRYEVMDLQDVKIPDRAGFGLIYCSNVLEHVADADAFLEKSTRLLAKDGVFVLAVPAITSVGALQRNVENIYHINNVTPPGWLAKMRRFFGYAQGYRHWLEPEWVTPSHAQVVSDSIRENNFTFTERSDEEMLANQRTITTVIVARGPRERPLPTTSLETSYPAEWGVEWGRGAQALRRGGLSHGTVGALCDGAMVEQAFVCPIADLSEVQVLLATYLRVNDSTLQMALRRDSADGPVVAESSAYAGDVDNNEWHSFRFPTVAGAGDRRFVLTLRSPDATRDTCLTAHYTNDALPGCDPVKVNGAIQPGQFLQFAAR